MKRFSIAMALLATLMIVSSAQAVHPGEHVEWVEAPLPLGAQSLWDLGAKWDRVDDAAAAGTAATILGRSNGWRESNGVVLDPTITIGNGANVLFDAEALGDFHLRSNAGGTGELIISGGSTLEIGRASCRERV